MSRIQMTRRVTFSSGHRYWNPSQSLEQNRATFGPWASPFNHGHNYVLEATVQGTVDPKTGMLVNIKIIDDVLRQCVVSDFDQRSLNDEVEEFSTTPPSVENILEVIRHRLTCRQARTELTCLPKEVDLVKLTLIETETLYGELVNHENAWKTSLTRTYEFAASHRLHAPNLSQHENDELYGKCNNPAGHGHNYVLEVTVSGTPDPKSGMLCDLGQLDSVVHSEVVDRYDHKNLNEDIPEFRDRVTTSEIVVQEIWSRLDGKVPAKLHRVRLFETARNAFEISRD
ncbi:MAG TPA: 6-carboxytetrahydropterin synthase [Fimbriimonadaceae bacterium]|nr:6-carboxytetrahydropterin synthase [Fimbriimonadaceae bacterium]